MKSAVLKTLESLVGDQSMIACGFYVQPSWSGIYWREGEEIETCLCMYGSLVPG